MEFESEKYKNEIKKRVSAIRFRTLSLTIAIIITLVFYFFLQATMKASINPIDFFFLCVVAFLVHCIYFPDGELFGQRSQRYEQNRKAYNEKADKVNEQRLFNELRKFCKVDFERRKERYVMAELGHIGITESEFDYFKSKSKKEIMAKEMWEIGDKDTKILILTKGKRKKLCRLLFSPIPIEENEPETIMSAVECSTDRRIRDASTRFKARSYIAKLFTSIVLGGVFAYIGYTLKDGITIIQITTILMFLTTIFSTAVTSFSSGEISQRVHRSQFYAELTLFLDEFYEWHENNCKKM